MPASFRTALLTALTALGMALAALPAAADEEQSSVRHGVARGAYKPLQTIIAGLGREHPGRVVDVEARRGPQGELRYDITLIDPQGRKHDLLVDAATGRILADEDTRSQQAMDMATLATHLRQLEQQSGRRVTEAEYELTRDGRAVYQLALSPATQLGSARHALIDARSGALLTPMPASAVADPALRSMPDMLQALAARHPGHVLEVELETDTQQTPYYELELRQPSGQTLKLRVDARSLHVLHQRADED